MWGLGIVEVLAITAAVATVLYMSVAKLARSSTIALSVGCMALVVTSFTAVPLAGLATFIAALIFAAIVHRRQLNPRRG